jgi:mono/diheme cytochrome c family protein
VRLHAVPVALLVSVALTIAMRHGASAESQPVPAESRQANPFEGDGSRIEPGRSLFNQYCFHCHAPNAQTPERVRDVRRLKLRYGSRMTEVFYQAVTEGRPSKGMPAWKGTLPDETLWTIYSFIQSVQKEP